MAHSDWRDDPKRYDLASALGVHPKEAWRIGAMLWDAVHRMTTVGPDGILPESTKPHHFAIWIENDPSEGETLVAALVKTKLVERRDGRFIIHNYRHWAPDYVLQRWKKRRQRVENADAAQLSRDRMGTVPQNAGTVPTTRPDQTRPDQKITAAPFARNGAKRTASEPSPGMYGNGRIRLNTNTRTFEGIEALDRQRWAEAYPAVDVDRNLAAAAIWCVDNPAKGRKSNYGRFLSGWMSREQEKAGRGYGGNGQATRSEARISAKPGKYAAVTPDFFGDGGERDRQGNGTKSGSAADAERSQAPRAGQAS